MSHIFLNVNLKNIDISILKSLSLTFVLPKYARYLLRKFQLLEAREPLTFAFILDFIPVLLCHSVIPFPSHPKPFLIKTDTKMEADKNSKCLHLLICHSFSHFVCRQFRTHA